MGSCKEAVLMSQPSSWSQMIGQFRLGWRLLHDPRVPWWTKLIPMGAVVYLLLPTDMIPDLFLGLGQLDDLGVLLLSLKAFVALCPRDAVLRHQGGVSIVEGVARSVDDAPTADPHMAGYLDSGAPQVVEGSAVETQGQH